MAKMRITGFARLLLFLILFLPLSLFGASYINGEDPMEKIRGFMGSSKAQATTTTQSSNAAATNAATADMEKRILRLERDLAVAEEKLARCKLEQQQKQ